MQNANTLHTTPRADRPRTPVHSGRVAVRSRVIGLALMLGALALTTTPAPSHAWTSWQTPPTLVDGRLVEVRVLVNEHATPLYASPKGDSRHYFEAWQGREYAVELHNTTGERIGVLMSVDGLNVISGQRSRLSNNETMYVLDPWERTVIKGWRTSLSGIRHFVFVDEARSYASRTGQANGDLGWVRVMAFREVRPLAWRPQWLNRNERRASDGPAAGQPQGQELDKQAARDDGREEANEPPASSPAPVAEGGAKDQLTRQKAGAAGDAKSMTERESSQSNPGTGWGREGYDPVRQVEFRAEACATDQLVMRYEYASGLVALGIEPVRSHRRTVDRDRGLLGFAQAPKW